MRLGTQNSILYQKILKITTYQKKKKRFFEMVKFIIPQNITDTLLNHNLNTLVNKTIDIGKLPHVSPKSLLVLRIEF